jgi:hypothetical protein
MSYKNLDSVEDEALQFAPQLDVSETVFPNALTFSSELSHLHPLVNEPWFNVDDQPPFVGRTPHHLSGVGMHSSIVFEHAPNHFPHNHPGYPQIYDMQNPIYPTFDPTSYIPESIGHNSNTSMDPLAEFYGSSDPAQVIPVQFRIPLVPESIIGGSGPRVEGYSDTNPSTSQYVVRIRSYREDPWTSAGQAQASRNTKAKKRCPYCGKFFDPKPSNWKVRVHVYTTHTTRLLIKRPLLISDTCIRIH